MILVGLAYCGRAVVQNDTAAEPCGRAQHDVRGLLHLHVQRGEQRAEHRVDIGPGRGGGPARAVILTENDNDGSKIRVYIPEEWQAMTVNASVECHCRMTVWNGSQ